MPRRYVAVCGASEATPSQLEAAKEHDLLVILDVQMGRSTVDLELPRLLPYLADPRVQLAIDPEWAMPAGVA